ncbi:hypothetical protein SDC9_136766 [bioreactor metagenome]|uniref:Uncharacterized protein n=1 Tax=bioreactor metagenome TaxID=1076179 RepID=A0A645DJN2_9ZZZZ
MAFEFVRQKVSATDHINSGERAEQSEQQVTGYGIRSPLFGDGEKEDAVAGDEARNHCRDGAGHHHRNQRRDADLREQHLGGEQHPGDGAVEDGGDSGAASARQQKRPRFPPEIEEFSRVRADGRTR